MAKTAEASNGTKAGKTATGGLRPLGSNVLVQRDKAEQRTSSGLYIPNSGRRKPLVGVVQAVGPGKIDEATGQIRAMTVKPGNRVLFSEYSGETFKEDPYKVVDEELLIIPESAILAIVED